MHAGKRYVFMAAAIALVLACSSRDPNDLFAPDAGTVVVYSVLTVDQPIPWVQVTRTISPGEPFTLQAAEFPNPEQVQVSIEGGGDVHEYVYRPSAPGMYIPRFPDVDVLPETSYRLTVRTPDGQTVTAVTTTPRRFNINDWVMLDDNGVNVIRQLETFETSGANVYDAAPNQLVYTQGLLEARFDNTGVKGFQVALFSLDDGSPPVVDSDLVDEEDLERTGSSPPFDAELESVRLPWFTIGFEGRYLIKIFSLDRNWYDLALSLPEFNGGGAWVGGSPGDEFDYPLFHIDGGIGLFGSAAVDSNGVFILPR